MRPQAEESLGPQEPGEQKGPSPRAPGGSTALSTPRFRASGLWHWEGTNFCCFKPPSVQQLVMVPPGR